MKQNQGTDRNICELALKALPLDLVSHLIQKVKNKWSKHAWRGEGVRRRVLKAFMTVNKICGNIK